MDNAEPAKRKPVTVSAEVCDKTAQEAEQLGLTLMAQILRDLAERARRNGGYIEA